MASYIRLLRRSGVTVKTRRQWGARFRASLNRFYPPGEYLFLHIAVIDASPSKRDRMRLIEWIGVQRFTRTHFPYNDVVFEDGDIYVGQPRKRKGAHTINDKGVSGYPYDLNAHGHAIALPQNVGDRVTDEQVDSIARWGAARVLSGESTADQIEPHRKFAWKGCPGDLAMAELDEINRRFRHYVKQGLNKPGPRINMNHLQDAWARKGGKVYNPWGRRAVRLWVGRDEKPWGLHGRGFTVEGWNRKRGWYDDDVRRATSKLNQNRDPDFRWDGKNHDRPTWAGAKFLDLRPYRPKRKRRVRGFSESTSKTVDTK